VHATNSAPGWYLEVQSFPERRSTLSLVAQEEYEAAQQLANVELLPAEATSGLGLGVEEAKGPTDGKATIS